MQGFIQQVKMILLFSRPVQCPINGSNNKLQYTYFFLYFLHFLHKKKGVLKLLCTSLKINSKKCALILYFHKANTFFWAYGPVSWGLKQMKINFLPSDEPQHP